MFPFGFCNLGSAFGNSASRSWPGSGNVIDVLEVSVNDVPGDAEEFVLVVIDVPGVSVYDAHDDADDLPEASEVLEDVADIEGPLESSGGLWVSSWLCSFSLFPSSTVAVSGAEGANPYSRVATKPKSGSSTRGSARWPLGKASKFTRLPSFLK